MARRTQPRPIFSPMALPPKPKGVWEKEYSRNEECESHDMIFGHGARLWISNGHIDYRGEWIARFFPLADSPRKLDATTAEEAKAKALEMAKAIIEPIYKLLQAAE